MDNETSNYAARVASFGIVSECLHTVLIKGHRKEECCGIIDPTILDRGAAPEFAQCALPAGHPQHVHHTTPNGARMFAAHRYKQEQSAKRSQ